ncbi:hypothetical protein KI688_006541 [Linnemannia hyalina]|uniref:Extracellular membrane protein CFEM domain-containing protein n=1 Tax=Linnemannia hyalina TaxID=64524 RepID=A0A9P7XKE4_9FUNG|nr:hypothetical protein KI688_006541 [Linnemannia hyalina]
MHLSKTFITALIATLTIFSSLSSPTTAQPPLNTILCYQCLEKAAVAITPSCAGLVSTPLSAIINPLALTDAQKSCYCGLGAASTSWAKTCDAPETCDSGTITQYIQSFAVVKGTVCLAAGIGNSLTGGNGAGQVAVPVAVAVKVAAGLAAAVVGAVSIF